MNPIYEGDYTNNYRELKLKKNLVQFKENQLIIITIPDCPFCMASIQTIKQIKKRIPKLNVKYIVCSNDNSSVKFYKKEINGLFPISITKKPKEWAKICQGKFPSYVLFNNSSIQIWSNDNFGTLAKDEIEKIFN